MKLLALLIGLGVERLASQLFQFRDMRWLDRIIDKGFGLSARIPGWPAVVSVLLLTLLLVLPVFLARFSIGDALYGFPYLILAIIVLFFSLGPNDIAEDVDTYCKALESGDAERIRVAAKAVIEADVPADANLRTRQFEEAVCVQANNRFFAVIFWFVVLGPVAAWAYRVTDLIRRRAVFNAVRERSDEGAASPDPGRQVISAATAQHGWLAWVPARLTAIGFGLAGSFDGATSAWRAPQDSDAGTQSEQSEQLLARVGTAALGLKQEDGETDDERAIRGALAANGMVFRLLFIWAAVIAAMTLYGLSV